MDNKGKPLTIDDLKMVPTSLFSLVSMPIPCDDGFSLFIYFIFTDPTSPICYYKVYDWSKPAGYALVDGSAPLKSHDALMTAVNGRIHRNPQQEEDSDDAETEAATIDQQRTEKHWREI